MKASEREFDVIVWGATGFTGRLVAEYLLERYGADADLRWAIGGRSREKLQAVHDELSAGDLPLIVADAKDTGAMRALAQRTRVICTTVGPYALYGSDLVAACAAAGTDYCDLAGETPWIQRMIDSHHDEARASGARIVHCCGFDSIPSDLGTFFLQREMQTRHGVACTQIRTRVKTFKGAFSGGTIASLTNMMQQAQADTQVNRVLADSYALNPKDQRSGPDGRDSFAPAWDDGFGQWTAPFIMAGINTRVVRRSNALLNYRYGRDFRYSEATLTGKGPLGLATATAITGGLGALMGALSVAPLRSLAQRWLPSPGEGPSKAQREAGFFDIRLRGEHEPTGNTLRVRVYGDRDPGYGSTAKMLGESAVCLARDSLDATGGVLTPASAMADALLVRLPANAGVTFSVE